ncbi:SsgA family sporulation/cell division regulator [Streptomyces sp. NBC_00481]|uniref:SsgA family sporulation/cell division regulator n=1 Tax=Streptomyces sp. NBC_00481 TaxID=2975755 RepID=UPI002DDAA681|nr:SsgA family sporulation/cell division regulator [Streptomyces sp. NBC_00481]
MKKSKRPKQLKPSKRPRRPKCAKCAKYAKYLKCPNWRSLMHPAQPARPTPPGLEQPARALVITPDYEEIAVRTTLRYTTEDPFAVHIDFPPGSSDDDANVTWTFARTLLAEGLVTPAGIGDVHLWPCGPAHTVVELRSPHGMAMIRFDAATLRRFLHRSYAVVALGGETLEPALDDGLASLLGGV